MSKFFAKVRGGLSLYVDEVSAEGTDCRFILTRFGEDPNRCIEEFWAEHPAAGPFMVAIVTAYGLPPRSQLCTRQSLTMALRTAKIEPNGTTEMGWKAACAEHKVPWAAHKAAPGWKAQDRPTEAVP